MPIDVAELQVAVALMESRGDMIDKLTVIRDTADALLAQLAAQRRARPAGSKRAAATRRSPRKARREP